MRNILRLFLLSVISILTFTCDALARDMYVRLSDKTSVSVRSDASMTLSDAAQKKFNLGKSGALRRSGSSVMAGKQKFQLPVRISSSGLLGFNGRKYRGEFLLTREFVLINVLDVEDYVRGVLPSEGVSSWPKEYQRAQAIISRTYGLQQSLNRSSRGYDVADSSSDQVYKGAGAETPATDQAVKETAGKVLAYGDTLAFTPFHSDSGGYTATNSRVWAQDIPYLTGVKEPVAYQSPNSSWTAKISASQVQAALSKIGKNVGRVKEIRVSELDAGGRAAELTFVGSSGSAVIKSSLFRTHIGPNLLKSTFLTGVVPMASSAQPASRAPTVPNPKTAASPNSSPQPPVTVSSIPLIPEEAVRLARMISDGVFTSRELLDMLGNTHKKRSYLSIGEQRSGSAAAPQNERGQAALPETLPYPDMPALSLSSSGIIPEENGHFIFRGKGWGHGVGLSQWGAMAMARDGWTAERILEYYYPGTAVKNFK